MGDVAPPVFGPEGMRGNLTSAQGQIPAAAPPDGATALQPSSPLAPSGPMPQPTPPPNLPNVNYPPMPAQPQQQKLGPAPDARDYHKHSMGFVSAMAVLGAVSSAFTRQSGNAALSAFAGALNGWQQGNLQAYENAAQKWEQDTKATLENNRQITEQYRLALENRKMNIDEQMSQIQLIATRYHDQMMYDAAASKNYTMVAQIYEKNHQFTQKAQEAADKLQEKREEQRQKNEQSAAYWLSPEGQARLPTLQPSQQAAIKQLIDIYASKSMKGGAAGQLVTKENAEREARGEPPMTAQEELSFIQRMRPPRSAPAMAMQKYIQEHPDATSDEIAAFRAQSEGKVAAARVTTAAEPRAEAAALSKLTQQKAAINSFERTAIANGEVLKKLADKVDKTGVPAIERWIRAGRQATGDVDVARFHAQMEVYRAEVAKIITNPNLGGVLTDTARREVAGFLSGSSSAKQIRGVVDLLEQDFGRRSKSIDDEIATVRSHLKGGAAKPGAETAPAGAEDPLGIR